MDVKEAIEKRRAYRSLEKVEIAKELVKDLAHHAGLSPSCFNKQPWRLVFVHEKKMLERMIPALSNGNEWASNASMIVAVYSSRDYDCVIHDREYYLFDTGMATAFLILRATELGLVAHPIAGFSPRKVKELLRIPDDKMLITLVIIGKHSGELSPLLSEKQKKDEVKRPERKNFEEVASINFYGENEK